MIKKTNNLTVIVNNTVYSFKMQDGNKYRDQLIKEIIPGYKYIVRTKSTSKYYVHELQTILMSLLQDKTLNPNSVIFLKCNDVYVVFIGTNNDKYKQYDRSNEKLDKYYLSK